MKFLKISQFPALFTHLLVDFPFFPALYQIISDMFFAGADTVTNMLRWVIFYMAKYPEVTKRAEKEIDEVVGGQLVSILYKQK